MKDPVDQESVQTCFHCGDRLPRKVIHLREKSFCCNGCATVFELLTSSGMGTYYELEERPGNKIDSDFSGRYAYLDLPEVQQKLIKFSEGDFARVTLNLPAIHCSSCIWLIENLHQLHEGVHSAEVSFTRKKASVFYNPQLISLRQLVELLVRLGYPPEINLATINKPEPRVSRSLYYKIGVAGFCFGNIMMLSLPEYLGMGEGWESYARYFGMLNILLALPVFTYTASGYYRSAWSGLRFGSVNIDVPITIGILALFGRSLYEIISGTGAGYMDSLAGLLFFLLIGKWFQEKTYQNLAFDRAYDSYFPVAATVCTADGEYQVPLKDLQPGMEILVRNQELIPADAELLSDEATIDFSFVTGESDPVRKEKGAFIYAGGKQSGAAIRLKVKQAVDQSYLTDLWNQQVFRKSDKTPVQAFINKVSQRFTIIVLLIAACGAVFWWIKDPSVMVQVNTAVLIVACPCALALAAPFSFGHTLRVLGRNKFYLRSADYVEKMASVTDIVVDKTGTLTHTNSYRVEFVGDPLSEEQQFLVAMLAGQSNHPLSRTIADYFDDHRTAEIADFEEVPGAGLRAVVNGRMVSLGSASWINGKTVSEKDATTKVFLKVDSAICGFFRLEIAYRQDIEVFLSQLGKQFRLHLLSGDHDGQQEKLSAFIPPDRMHFRQSPYDKLKYIEGLRQEGRVVVMLGDGLNDAGALKAADVGISVADDVYAFAPACDAIFDGKAFQRLPALLHLSAGAMSVVKWSIALSFFYNIIGLSFALSGMLSPLVAAILMPVSSVSVVAFTTGLVNWKARKSSLQ